MNDKHAQFINNGKSNATRQERAAVEERKRLTLDQPTTYRIRIQGVLGQEWVSWFDNGKSVSSVEIATEHDTTVLSCTVIDQPALYGLLVKLRDLGLPLISSRCLEFNADRKDQITMSEHTCANIETIGAAAKHTPKKEVARAASDWKAWAQRLGLTVLFFVCGLLVFVLGIDYHTHFATNTSGLYKIGLSAALSAAAIAMRRSERLRPYWRIAFAFFVASLPNVLTWYLAPLRGWLLNLFRLGLDTPQGITVGKFWDVLLKVVPILVLVKLSGDGLDTVYLKRGDLRWGMTIGLLAAGNLLTTAIVVAASRNVDLAAIVPSVPWWFMFSLGNAFMEELWCRGLLLKRLEPFIGARTSVWVTSLVFALMHAFALYVTSPTEAVVIGVLTFTLGFAWALLMQKTDSIWGSVLFHLAADLYIFIGLGGF